MLIITSLSGCCVICYRTLLLQGVSLAYGLVSTQQFVLKERNRTITGLRGEADKLTSEKEMGEELPRLHADTRLCGEEMVQLRKKLIAKGKLQVDLEQSGE